MGVPTTAPRSTESKVSKTTHVSFSDWGKVVEAAIYPKDEDSNVVRVRIPTARVKYPYRKALRWLAAHHPQASHSYNVERGACAPVEYD
jgi:hypothetical protein